MNATCFPKSGINTLKAINPPWIEVTGGNDIAKTEIQSAVLEDK